ncbi:hypothetical protein, partial [Escherichia coli]|uniref:hypothetical protein n=1 Tax=Escherichia coli TaxID=562 RepID=UPI0019633825
IHSPIPGLFKGPEGGGGKKTPRGVFFVGKTHPICGKNRKKKKKKKKNKKNKPKKKKNEIIKVWFILVLEFKKLFLVFIFFWL